MRKCEWGSNMTISFTRFFADQNGTTSIEYALIAAGIAVAILATINALGGTVLAAQFSAIADALTH